MAISGLHLLLTYQCNFECDHCFVWGSPEAKGTMSIADFRGILSEAADTGTIDRIYFEGGEPFLYYPILLRGLREAKEKGFMTGIVTNAYWGTSAEDAREWLTPILETGIDDMSISDDAYHYPKGDPNLAKCAARVAEDLGLPVNTITIQEVQQNGQEYFWGGEPVTGGPAMFKGRAAAELTKSLATTPWTTFDECFDEDFSNQRRVHLDAYGHVHVCQGISIGNYKSTSLREILENFDPMSHPICGPILEGGPAELATRYGVSHEAGYVDECHLCYDVRLKLRHRFPAYLAPGQVYGEIGSS